MSCVQHISQRHSTELKMNIIDNSLYEWHLHRSRNKRFLSMYAFIPSQFGNLSRLRKGKHKFFICQIRCRLDADFFKLSLAGCLARETINWKGGLKSFQLSPKPRFNAEEFCEHCKLANKPEIPAC